MKMPAEVLAFFANYIQLQLGIVYNEDNFFQLESRLQEVVRFFDLKDPQVLYEKAQKGLSGTLKQYVLDVATNNETSFFRDTRVYRQLMDHLIPTLSTANGKKEINIWSAAASSGQESYSVSIILSELGIPGKILATDISERILKKAESGTYSQLEVQRGLPTPYLLKYFRKVDNDNWQVNAPERARVTFRPMNLRSGLQLSTQFDLILCRNVLIYQTVQAKSEILRQMARFLKPTGALVLGSSESLLGLKLDFQQVVHEGIAYYKLESADLKRAI